VNLTCGRNPWKKASLDDSTFRAFLKDPNFLSSILPLAPELNMILRRIFECDPQQRISLAELRDLILACPRFTMSSYHELPPSPPVQIYEYVDTMDCANMALPPSPPASPPPNSFHDHVSQWSLFSPSTKQSSGSSSSTDSGYESDSSPGDISQPQPFNFYGNIIPFNEYEKHCYQHQYNIPSVALFWVFNFVFWPKSLASLPTSGFYSNTFDIPVTMELVYTFNGLYSAMDLWWELLQRLTSICRELLANWKAEKHFLWLFKSWSSCLREIWLVTVQAKRWGGQTVRTEGLLLHFPATFLTLPMQAMTAFHNIIVRTTM